MGVMFRYQDDNNYYRIAIDSTFGVAWLIKRVAGTVTLLWAAPFTISIGEDYDTTILAPAFRWPARPALVAGGCRDEETKHSVRLRR